MLKMLQLWMALKDRTSVPAFVWFPSTFLECLLSWNYGMGLAASEIRTIFSISSRKRCSKHGYWLLSEKRSYPRLFHIRHLCISELCLLLTSRKAEQVVLLRFVLFCFLAHCGEQNQASVCRNKGLVDIGWAINNKRNTILNLQIILLLLTYLLSLPLPLTQPDTKTDDI